MNLYAYVKNNPLKYLDPKGKKSMEQARQQYQIPQVVTQITEGTSWGEKSAVNNVSSFANPAIATQTQNASRGPSSDSQIVTDQQILVAALGSPDKDQSQTMEERLAYLYASGSAWSGDTSFSNNIPDNAGGQYLQRLDKTEILSKYRDDWYLNSILRHEGFHRAFTHLLLKELGGEPPYYRNEEYVAFDIGDKAYKRTNGYSTPHTEKEIKEIPRYQKLEEIPKKDFEDLMNKVMQQAGPWLYY